MEPTKLTASKLLRAFMQFRKLGWSHRSLEGFKPSEFKMLYFLRKGTAEESNEAGMMVSELSQLLRVTSPTVTQQIKELEAAGMVERTMDAHDRRVVRVKLSPKGASVIQKASDDIVAEFHDLVEHLGEDESNQLADLLIKTVQYYHHKSAGSNDPRNGDEYDA